MADGFAGVCAVLGTCAVLGIMLATVSDVVGRFVLRSSVGGAVESAELLLVAAAFLGLGLAQGKRAHVSIRLLHGRLPPRWGRVMDLIAGVALLAFLGWAGWASVVSAWDAFQTGDYRFGLVNIPTWPARAAISIGFLSIFLQVLAGLLDPGRVRPEPVSTLSDTAQRDGARP